MRFLILMSFSTALPVPVLLMVRIVASLQLKMSISPA